MPVADVAGSKSPFNSFKSNAGLDIRVFIDVTGVVIINEAEAIHLIKNGKSD